MSSPQMVESVRALVADGERVEEVVVVQERPRWVIPAGVGVFIIVWLVGQQFEWGPLLSGGVAGGMLGAVYGLGAKTFLLAKAGERTLLLRSEKLRVRAVSIVEEIPNGTQLRRVGRMFNDTLDLGGRRIVVSRIYRDRLARIMPISEQTA